MKAPSSASSAPPKSIRACSACSRRCFVIWCGFDIATAACCAASGGLFGGSFLTPRNLWTLLVQTSSIAIMSTGMVLLIVMRQLDLSVGSMLSDVAVAMGVLQVFDLGRCSASATPRSGSSPWSSPSPRCLRSGSSTALTAYRQIPSLHRHAGGLLAYSGLAFLHRQGETVAPMDKTFKLFGGNSHGSIGPFWSWVLAPWPASPSVSALSMAGGSASASSSRCGRSGPRCSWQWLAVPPCWASPA
jgi:D-xylose transport system permease protein